MPTELLVKDDGSPVDGSYKTLRWYSSSPGRQRGFCESCGATIFWKKDDRPGAWDVSVGLFRANEGALARDWLTWHTNRIAFVDDAFDKGLQKVLQKGYKNVAD